MLSVIAGEDSRDPAGQRSGSIDFTSFAQPGSLDGVRVARTTQLGWPTPCEPEIAQRVADAADVLQAAGATVEEASPPIGDPNEVFPTLSAVGAAANYGRMCVGQDDDLSDYTRGSLRRGSGLSGVKVAEAYAAQDRLKRRMDAWFVDYDVLLTPTSAIAAPRHNERIEEIAGVSVSPWTTSILYTPIANLNQAPAIAMPAGLGSDGLPLSVQIVAREGNDAMAIRCAAVLEDAGFRASPPTPV